MSASAATIRMLSGPFRWDLEAVLARSKPMDSFFFKAFKPLLTYGRFAYDSMKLILSRLVWRFNLKLEEAPQGKTDWIMSQLAFVSFHQPPLNVALEVRA